jgi:tetratricopeptide (TPR) repeat protein
LLFLRDFATDEQMAGFAEAWLKYAPALDEPLWLPAQLSRLRTLARKDPARALTELRGLDSRARLKYARPLEMLELDLLVFYLHDRSVPDMAKRIAFENPKSDMERFAKIRSGDYFRLAGQYPQAVAQYQEAQKLVGDESAGRKLPAQDKAFSVAIRQLLDANRRAEASDKLDEWEMAHPMAKLDGDFLLLRARMLDAFGRWNEALSELDSLEKMQPDSPYMIDVEFYRAQALDGLGKKEEARKIWNDIAKNYPKHELAAQSKTLASKP